MDSNKKPRYFDFVTPKKANDNQRLRPRQPLRSRTEGVEPNTNQARPILNSSVKNFNVNNTLGTNLRPMPRPDIGPRMATNGQASPTSGPILRPAQKVVNRPAVNNYPRTSRYYDSKAQAGLGAVPGHKQHKKHHKKRNILISLVVLLLIIGGGLGYSGWFINHLLKRIDVAGFTNSVGGAENILVAGDTTRCGLKFQSSQWGFCSQVGGDENSDIIMIVHLVPKTHQVSLLSIPRDTFVPNARKGGESFKIDAALYQGPGQLVNAIQEDFGIPIQHYVEVNFDGFVNVVNAIGGVKMDFPMPVYDAYSHLNVPQAGCVKLTGLTALQLIRARHLQYKPPTITTNDKYYWPYEINSDIGRIARTHEFLRVLASTVQQKGLGNPLTDERLVSSIFPNLIVDSGLTDSTLLNLIEEFHNASVVNAPQYTLPVAITPFGNYYFEGSNFGDVVFPVESTDQNIIDKFLGTTSNVDTMTGKPLPSPKTITVSVMNGSGSSGQASTIADGLQSLGFSINGTGDVAPVSRQAQETYVYYKPGYEPDAMAVAHQLTGYVIMSVNAAKVKDGANVTVVTGTATSVNGVASNVANNSGSSSTNQAATSTQTSSSIASGSVNSKDPSDGFSAPSNSNEGLTPWDPRACTK